jgi:alkylation response protein AidB-like acyl-CoA dehydrogenase
MDFTLAEEQELLQETVRGFAENECPATTVREIFDGDRAREPALWKGLIEMGIAGLTVDERFGGAGLGLLEAALVSEELGRGAVPVPYLGHALACIALSTGGSDAQKERWLPRLASGEALGTVAFAEGGDVWEPDAWQTRFADGALSGTKHHVLAGAAADLIVVGTAGGTLVIVDASADGVRSEPMPTVDRGRPLAAIEFDNTAAEALESGDAAILRDAGLVLLAADAFGAADRLIHMSAGYANTRQQFGQVIGQFQGVKHQIADMAVDVVPTRGLWWYAAHAWDRGLDDASRAAGLAKSHISDRAQQVARDAVEIHGGIGFTWECDVQIWFKRVMFDRLFLGTPEQQRERLATTGGW